MAVARDVAQGPQGGPVQIVAPWGGLSVHEAGVPLKRAKRALLLIHGYGADANDLREVGLRLSDESRKETAILLPEAPIGLAQGGFAWFELNGAGFDDAVAKLRALLAYFHEQYPKMPYALGGFSQGAILTANLLSATAPNLRALLIFSGADLVGTPPADSAVRRPVFISHGREDRMLSFNQGKQLADAFATWGYKVEWLPFSGGHNIPPTIVAAAEEFLGENFRDEKNER